MTSAMKLGLLAGALAIGIAGAVVAQPGEIGQLQMALDNLNAARDHVRAVDRDAEGHRQRAMDLINSAIDEVRNSMREERTDTPRERRGERR